MRSNDLLCAITSITALASLTTPTVAQNLPELAVGSIDKTKITGNWQTLQIAGTAEASIVNTGNAAATRPFTVVFFEDTNGNSRYDARVDHELGRTTLPSLGANTKANVAASVSGSVRFRDAPLWVVVDSTNEITEIDETNNLWDTGRQCLVDPKGPLEPILEWSWTSSKVLADWLNVMMTPGVIDLDADKIPDIVFGSTNSRSGGNVEVGVLRALSGKDGSELFTITDAQLRVNTAASVAVGDIDGDKRPEIIACDSTGRRLIVFEHDGKLKWRSGNLEAINWGAPALADLNGDGTPEIVIGRQALDNTGKLLWTGQGGRAYVAGPISCVADVDLDGKPEVIAGNTIYSNTGQIKWRNTSLPDGHNAIANFDKTDDTPEIVLVAKGVVRLLEHDMRVIWSRSIPGGGAGGPPTVADYDNDGNPEIGVAGARSYTVFEDNGNVRWTKPTQDLSSNVTGSSVFDFNGDGSAEVVYRDELRLRIYRGTTGEVLWSVPMSSCTWHEYVLVADIDADGNSEIVAVANNNCGLGRQRGVFVYGAKRDNWVATRQIWNQHSYHITNIEDDGTVPKVERNNWQFPSKVPFNNYRQNVLDVPPPTAAPDLSASLMRLPCTLQNEIRIRVGNGGGIFIAAGLPVSFYDGDPTQSGKLLATVRTSKRLEPGEFEDVAWTVPSTVTLKGPIHASVDDSGNLQGTQTECDETNNRHSLALCTTTATSANYGSGCRGTRGVPSLTLSARPLLGERVDVLIGNSSDTITAACLLFGTKKDQRRSPFGCDILVTGGFDTAVLLKTDTTRLPLQIPCLHEWCGARVYVQALVLDGGATRGVAATRGLEIVLGAK